MSTWRASASPRRRLCPKAQSTPPSTTPRTEPVVLGAEGIDTDTSRWIDYLRIPANGLVTNEQTLQDEPELVCSHGSGATLRSIQYTLDNPDEAFEIALKYVPEAGGDNAEINRAVFDASLDFWTPVPATVIGESTLSGMASGRRVHAAHRSCGRSCGSAARCSQTSISAVNRQYR